MDASPYMNGPDDLLNRYKLFMPPVRPGMPPALPQNQMALAQPAAPAQPAPAAGPKMPAVPALPSSGQADPRTLQPEPTRGQFMPPVRSTGQKFVRGLESAGMGIAARALGGNGVQEAVDFYNKPTIEAGKEFEQAHQTWQGDQNAARQVSQDDLTKRNMQSEIDLRNAQATKDLAPKVEKPEDVVKQYSDALAGGDTARAAELKPRVQEFLDTTDKSRAPAPKPPKEEIQQQLSGELAKPKPDQAIIKGLQDRLRALDPLAEDRLKDSENRAADATRRAADAKSDKTDKADLATKEKVLTYFKPAQDADARLNLMEESYNKATKENDQQAMVNLLANHIAMTMGLPRGKVPRVNHQLFTEAQASAPWLQRVESHFDKEGYLTGVVLSADQMKRMVGLAKETREEEWKQANAAADYIGVKERPQSTYSGAPQSKAAGAGPAAGQQGNDPLGIR